MLGTFIDHWSVLILYNSNLTTRPQHLMQSLRHIGDIYTYTPSSALQVQQVCIMGKSNAKLNNMLNISTQVIVVIMDAEQFRRCGKEMIDFVADYLENIRDRRALPDVNPGYLIEQMPEEAPDKPEQWEDVFGDIEKLIMPGVCMKSCSYLKKI